MPTRKPAEQRQFADAASLEPVVRAVFGTGCEVAQVERLSGGSKKGAYRVDVDGRAQVLVYVWNQAEDFWQGVLPEDAEDPADPFSHASGLDWFEAAARRLAAFEACRAEAFGKVAVVDAGQRSHGSSCERAVLDRAVREVSEVSAGEALAARDAARLTELLHTLAAPLQPRTTAGLVHGELGPDHVLLDGDGEPVLIDIEGLMYFDAEWEHVWMRMRFGEHYARLLDRALDPDRLRFYQLALHLNLVAGPLRIARTGHPDREWFRETAEYHLGRALTFWR